MADKNFIQKAIKHPGALRDSAKHMGLIKGDQKLSMSDMQMMKDKAMKSGNDTMMRRAELAMTLSHLRKGKK